MRFLDQISDYFDSRRKRKHEKIRTKAEKLKRQGKNPTKKGWGSMVNTGYGGINKYPTDRPYDVAQQQKNLAEEKQKK